MEDLKEGEVVTLPQADETVSNTYVLYKVLEDDSAILTHPLTPDVYTMCNKFDLNTEPPRLRCSTDRGVSFIFNNREVLDYNSKLDLEAICTAFVIRRKLTPKQKKILADLSGKVAQVQFNSDVKRTMKYITENKVLLDDFNLMWYNNFSKLFLGKQQISSQKQANAIFNMAGFILGELSGNQHIV